MSDEWNAQDDSAFRQWAVEDGASRQMGDRDATHPSTTVMMFLQAIEDPVQYLHVLEQLVTPESRDAWGDFSATQAGIDSIENWGWGQDGWRGGDEAPDVAYFALFPGVDESYQVDADEPVQIAAAAVFTLVWRPESEMWQIHALGQPIDPSELPRTSPGVTPET